MIKSFRHKGLKRLYEADDRSRLPPDMVPRIQELLTFLDVAASLDEMNRPSFRLHPLKGRRVGEYAVVVRGPWRIVFRFEDGDAYDVNFEDYH